MEGSIGANNVHSGGLKMPGRPLAGEFQLSQKEFRKQKFRDRIQGLKTLFSLRAAMAEERFISRCDLSSSNSSFSISSPDSTASSAFSDDITDSSNSSRGFSPPPIPDGNGGPLFHMKSLSASLPSRKRSLSVFFTGKSQSFTSLADVNCVEDLAKPEKKLRSSHSWESTIKSSYNNQTFRSVIFLAGSAESMKIPRKASYGSKMGKKNGRLIPTNSYRLPLSPPKQNNIGFMGSRQYTNLQIQCPTASAEHCTEYSS